jgi:arylsulfatase A-like enzyme
MLKALLRKRWPWITAALLVVVAYASTLLEIRIGRPDSRPLGTAADIEGLSERGDLNVLFVLIDTLRAERLGSYGYERDTSPILDHLASRGVRFGRHLSQSSWTKCSMASLWTGLYPARSGVTRFQDVLSQEARMPAEVLRDAGFRTAGIFRNGWVEGYFGFDQGFDLYTRPAPTRNPPQVRRENPTLKEGGTDQDAVRQAIEFLRVHGKQRWFLYLHLMDVHEYLYDEASALFGSAYSDVYDNSIRWTDSVLNDLLMHLSEKKLLDRTLIVIASDHGEAFGERGLEGHARYVYRETTEVPWILGFPFRLEPGLVVETRTQNVDVWPTLLDLLGLPSGENLDGRSRMPEILAAARGERPPEEPMAVAHLDRTWGRRQLRPSPTVALSQGDLRYVLSREPNGRTREELFDASSDPGELRNVIAESPDAAERLRAQAKQYLESQPTWAEAPPQLEMDEIKLNQLRALGYAVP